MDRYNEWQTLLKKERVKLAMKRLSEDYPGCFKWFFFAASHRPKMVNTCQYVACCYNIKCSRCDDLLFRTGGNHIQSNALV